MASPVCSNTVRVHELLHSPSAAATAQAAADVAPAGGGATVAAGGAATRTLGGNGGSAAAAANDAEGGGAGLRRRRGRGGAEAAAVTLWGEAVAVDTVALIELYGEGTHPFDELRAHVMRGVPMLGGAADGGGAAEGTGRDSPNAAVACCTPQMAASQHRGSGSSARPAGGAAAVAPTPASMATLGSAGRTVTTSPQGQPQGHPRPDGGGGGGVLLQLMGVGRSGHTALGALRIGLSTDLHALASGSDLVRAPLRLKSTRGEVVAEVCASIAFSRAVAALQSAPPRMLSGGAVSGAFDVRSAQSGAALAVGVGEAFLLMRASPLFQRVLPTSVWVEVDLRRSCGHLLRSPPRPAGTPSVDFALRELLYIPDASAAQRRLAAALADPSHAASLATFSVFCTATPRAALAARAAARLPTLPPREAEPAETAAPSPPPDGSSRRRGDVGSSGEGADAATNEAAKEGGAATEAPAEATTTPEKGRASVRATSADGSSSRREGAAMEADPAAAHAATADPVTLGVTRAQPVPSAAATGAAGDPAVSEAEADAAILSSAPSRFLVGTASLSLRHILHEQHDAVTEPLELRDADGNPAGDLLPCGAVPTQPYPPLPIAPRPSLLSCPLRLLAPVD